jgi:outer membrane protein assembly factor BamB
MSTSRKVALLLTAALMVPGPIPAMSRAQAEADFGTEVTNLGMNAAHSFVQPNETVAPPLREVWRTDFDGNPGNPIVAAGRIFIGVTGEYGSGDQADIYGLSLADGSPLWGPVSVPEVRDPAFLTYTDDRLIVLAHDGRLHALAAATGAELWELDLGGEYDSFDAAPVAYAGVVYVGGGNSSLDKIFAVDASAGTVSWSHATFFSMRRAPTVDATGVYVAGECIQLRLSLTGEEVWANHDVPGCSYDADWASQLAGGRLYAGNGYVTDVYAIDDGSFVERLGVACCPIAISDGLRVAVEEPGTITARDAGGLARWRNARHSGGVAGPVVAAGYAYFGYDDGIVSAVDLRTGRTVWSTQAIGGTAFDDTEVHHLAVGHGRLVVPVGNQLVVYEPVPVSVRGPKRALVGSHVTLVTHSDPYASVEIYLKGPHDSDYSLLAARDADGRGRATATFTIRGDSSYYAISGGVDSPIRHTDAIPRVSTPPDVPATRALNYQIGASHSGYRAGETIRAPLRRLWSHAFPGRVSYPLVFGGRIFVVTERSQREGWEDPGTRLYALEAATGKRLWGPLNLDSGYRFAAIASDGTRLFVLNERHKGSILSALDPATGNELWSTAMGGNGAPPTVSDGIVFLGGPSAIVAATGEFLWSINSGLPGSPSVARSRVTVGVGWEPCARAYSLSGELLWPEGACDGAFGTTAAVHDGRVYARTPGPDDGVFRASDGTLLHHFNAEPIPTFAGQVGLRVWDGHLIAFDVSSGATRWRSGYIGIEMAPIVANGVAYAVTATQHVRAYRVSTGKLVWKAPLEHAFLPRYDDSLRVWSALTVAEGKLFIPTGRYLVAFSPQ